MSSIYTNNSIYSELFEIKACIFLSNYNHVGFGHLGFLVRTTSLSY